MSKLNQTASSGGGAAFEVPEADSHPAVFIAVVDLGTHNEPVKDRETGAETRKDFHKVLIAWELPTQRMSGTKNRSHVVGQEYNLTFNSQGNFRKMIEAVRGKQFGDGESFDPEKLLGQYALVTLVHKESQRGNTYARIQSVTKLPSSMPKPAPTLKPFLFDDPSSEVEFPEWLPFVFGESAADKLARCKERRNRPRSADEAEWVDNGLQGDAAEADEQIPF